MSSPNDGNRSGGLSSVTCPAVNDCWAVGGTLIERYTGHGWAIVSSPNDGSLPANYLSGVTCTRPRNCWAVGHRDTSSGVPQSLIEHYTGSGWVVVSSPTGAMYSGLSAVTCVGANDCWAVGGQGRDPLIEHYTGSGWGIVNSPSPSNEGSSLSGVTCNSVRDCWAVGSYSEGHNETLIEHYTNSGWAIVGSPSPSEQNWLGSVSCSNSSSCWAVGAYEPGLGSGGQDSLIEDYTGGAWDHVSSPNPGNLESLNGVACADPLDCWAVGSATNFIGNSQAFIVRDSGSGWAVDSSPNPGTSASNLNSVTCLSATDCWAVGESFDERDVEKTLIEHYSRTAAQP